MRKKVLIAALFALFSTALAVADGEGTQAPDRSVARGLETLITMVQSVEVAEANASPFEPPGRPPGRPPGSPPGQNDPPNPPGKPEGRPPTTPPGQAKKSGS